MKNKKNTCAITSLTWVVQLTAAAQLPTATSRAEPGPQ